MPLVVQAAALPVGLTTRSPPQCQMCRRPSARSPSWPAACGHWDCRTRVSTCIAQRYLAKRVTLQVVLLCCAVQQAMRSSSSSARQAAACIQAKPQARQGASAWHAPAVGRPVLQWVLLAKVRLCVLAMLDFTILPCSIRHGLPACCRSPGCAARSQLLVVRVLAALSGSKMAFLTAGLAGVRSSDALCMHDDGAAKK